MARLGGTSSDRKRDPQSTQRQACNPVDRGGRKQEAITGDARCPFAQNPLPHDQQPPENRRTLSLSVSLNGPLAIRGLHFFAFRLPQSPFETPRRHEHRALSVHPWQSTAIPQGNQLRCRDGPDKPKAYRRGHPLPSAEWDPYCAVGPSVRSQAFDLEADHPESFRDQEPAL